MAEEVPVDLIRAIVRGIWHTGVPHIMVAFGAVHPLQCVGEPYSETFFLEQTNP